jgi:TRAP-type C4-dicarboxylate transport system permease small subunit
MLSGWVRMAGSRPTMVQTNSEYHKALRLIVMINIPCLLLFGVMMWVSYQKAAETASARAAYLPMDAQVRDLIESERDIERLRSIARIQNIGASGSMEALLSISRKSAASLLPAMVITLATVLVAGISIRKARPPVAVV